MQQSVFARTSSVYAAFMRNGNWEVFSFEYPISSIQVVEVRTKWVANVTLHLFGRFHNNKSFGIQVTSTFQKSKKNRVFVFIYFFKYFYMHVYNFIHSCLYLCAPLTAHTTEIQALAQQISPCCVFYLYDIQ